MDGFLPQDSIKPVVWDEALDAGYLKKIIARKKIDFVTALKAK